MVGIALDRPDGEQGGAVASRAHVPGSTSRPLLCLDDIRQTREKWALAMVSAATVIVSHKQRNATWRSWNYLENQGGKIKVDS